MTVKQLIVALSKVDQNLLMIDNVDLYENYRSKSGKLMVTITSTELIEYIWIGNGSYTLKRTPHK